jgi:signal transduction histidine kinase
LAAILAGLAVYAAYGYRVARLLELERVRTRIATDLHDDIGASLSRMAILSEVVKRQVGSAQVSVPMLTEIADSARGLVSSMRDIVWSIDPRRDDLNSLISRVRQFAYDVLEPRGVKCEFEVPAQVGGVRLGPDERRHLFLIFKEAINNISRHAECSSVLVRLAVEHSKLKAKVRDDGQGFTPPVAETSSANGGEGHGLNNMRARAAQLGGSLTIHSSRALGTTLELIVPLRRR